MSNLDNIANRLSNLRLTQQQKLTELLDRHRQEEADLLSQINQQPATPQQATPQRRPRVPSASPPCFCQPRAPSPPRDHHGTKLALGDSVRILTPGKTGVINDIAYVTRFTPSNTFVGIRLCSTGTPTQRAPTNLEFVRRLPQ